MPVLCIPGNGVKKLIRKTILIGNYCSTNYGTRGGILLSGVNVTSSTLINNTCFSNVAGISVNDNGNNYSPPEQTLLDEGFQGTFLPTGWQQYGTGPNSWVQGYFTGPIAGPDGSTYYAIHGWDANYINRSLETASVNLTGYASASLEYYIYHNGTWGDIIYTEISTDGGGSGGTWITLATHNTDHGGWSP